MQVVETELKSLRRLFGGNSLPLMAALAGGCVAVVGAMLTLAAGMIWALMIWSLLAWVSAWFVFSWASGKARQNPDQDSRTGLRIERAMIAWAGVLSVLLVAATAGIASLYAALPAMPWWWPAFFYALLTASQGVGPLAEASHYWRERANLGY